MPTDVKTFLDFGGLGFLAFMSWLIFKAYQGNSERMLTVIENNTVAITRLCLQSNSSDVIAQGHDARAEHVGYVIDGNAALLLRIDACTNRIENILAKHSQAKSYDHVDS